MKKQVTLEKIQFGLKDVMSPALLDDIKVTEENDPILNARIRYISWFLWGNRIHKEEYSVDRPEGWWQYFKWQHFPSWLQRHFPIKMEKIVHTTNYNHLCPHLNYRLPKEDNIHLEFLSASNEDIIP